jgi:prophage regulatory protein
VKRKRGVIQHQRVRQTPEQRPAHREPLVASALDSGAARLQRLQSVHMKFLRFDTVRDRTGLSRSTIWRLERRGEFPRHRRISMNAVGWVEDEIDEWMLARCVP